MNLLLIGPPGVGKGTQARYLVSKYSLDYITTGDILRKNSCLDTEIGNKIRKMISSGALVSDEIVESLVVSEVKSCSKGILFDGYPRTVLQAHNLDNILNASVRTLSLVINMKLNDDVLIKRISGRFVCAECSSVYNKYFVNTLKDGVCDKCGSKDFITRSDDNENVIKKRLNIFHSENNAILEYYRLQGILVDISCEGNVIDISNKISCVIDSCEIRI